MRSSKQHSMTLGDIAATARFLTGTDSVSYTDAQMLININTWYQKVVTMILESMDESDFDDARKTNYPIQTTPMVANQRDYTMPVSEKVLKIKRLDVSWDGGTTYYKAEPLDDGEIPYGLGNDSQTDTNFSQKAPRYDVKYNAFWLYPMPLAADVTNGGLVRVEWERQIQEFTSGELTAGTVVPGFDDPFHPMLAQGAAYDYAFAKQLPQLGQLQQNLADWEVRLRTHYGRKELDRRLAFQTVFDTDYGR